MTDGASVMKKLEEKKFNVYQLVTPMVSILLLRIDPYCPLQMKHLEELETDDGQEEIVKVDEDSVNDQGKEWQEEFDSSDVIELADKLCEAIVKVGNIKLFKRSSTKNGILQNHCLIYCYIDNCLRSF